MVSSGGIFEGFSYLLNLFRYFGCNISSHDYPSNVSFLRVRKVRAFFFVYSN